MCWQLIPQGPYQPFHDLTYASSAAPLGCFSGTRRIDSQASAEPATEKDKAQSVPSWFPVIETVIEALDPFEEASLAVSQALQNKHPEHFEENSPARPEAP